MDKLKFKKEIDNIRKKILKLLTCKNLLKKENRSQLLQLKEEINKFTYKHLHGNSLEDKIAYINKKNKRWITFQVLDLSSDKNGEDFLPIMKKLSTRKVSSLKEYYQNSLEELLDDYYQWLEKAEKRLLTKNLKLISDLNIANYLLNQSNRIVLRRAAGLIVSLKLSEHLLFLHQKEEIKPPNDDDILPLCNNLRHKTKNKKLKTFLNKKYPYFQQAGKTRIKCAHLNEGVPLKSEIETMLKETRELLSSFKV